MNLTLVFLKMLASTVHDNLVGCPRTGHVCVCVCVSVCLSVCLSVRPSVRPSICLSVCLSICLFVSDITVYT